jgi:hypothetical protein
LGESSHRVRRPVDAATAALVRWRRFGDESIPRKISTQS